jgi:2-oxoglutarate dehydrogenase E2 component (dihydrolipoamide succinyltransferase)
VSIEVKVPQLPESVADATLVAWHKKPGDTVRREENLVDLETDKVVLEVPAPADGVIKEIVAAGGAVVTSGQVLAILEPGSVAASAAPPPAAKAAPAPAPTAAPAKPAAAKPASTPPAAAPAPSAAAGPAVPAVASAPRSAASANKMGPAVRKLVEEHDLDPSAIAGSGREGRITKGDVLDYIADHQATTVGIEHDVLSRAGVGAEAPAPPRPGSARVEQRVAMTRLRARIAERLLQAQQQAAMLTTFNEVDMSAVMALRERRKEAFTKKYGVGVGIASFFVKAAIGALKAFPQINAEIQGDEIVFKNYYDIGMAVGAEGGLVVPVIRDADRMGFAGIELAIRDFAKRAQDGSLTLEDLKGGTFTITNGGVFGSLMSTPILNPPQVGILGLHKIADRAVPVNGQVVIRPMMYLALSYDHRIVDGREAVQFLVKIKDYIEDPAWMLLEG